jgi:hypothetical protein
LSETEDERNDRDGCTNGCLIAACGLGVLVVLFAITAWQAVMRSSF